MWTFFRCWRRLCSLPLAALPLLPALAFAQVPVLPNEEDYGRRSDDFTLSFCVDPRDPGWEVDLAIGEAIAAALLLEPKPFIVADTNRTAPFDDIYIHLRADCRVYFGFKLISEAYPDWVTVTRPYYETGYVFVARPPAPARLDDIARGTPIGATLGSSADFRLVQYNNSIPAAQRWTRHPYSSDQQSLRAVADGKVAAALVWRPSLAALARTEPVFAELQAMSPDPVTLDPMPVGALLLSSEVYFRSLLDEAIAALVEDGTIAAILAEHGMIGTVPGAL